MTAPGPRGERGSVTLWVLGLSVMMLFIGGITLDLWRAFSDRRALAGTVDAAAVAGANGIDTTYFRATSQVRLDPALAERLAGENLLAQPDARSLVDAQVNANSTEVRRRDRSRRVHAPAGVHERRTLHGAGKRHG